MNQENKPRFGYLGESYPPPGAVKEEDAGEAIMLIPIAGAALVLKAVEVIRREVVKIKQEIISCREDRSGRV